MASMSETRARITGIGKAVPKKVLTNEDFEEFLDTTDEWIVKRTGMKKRHVVGEGESTATLAVAAAREALEKTGSTADQLDLIICTTITPEMQCPSTACFVHDALGCGDIPAFDIAAACSGFVYGISVADQFIRSGTYKKVLVIGADAMSRTADYTDRGTCILFGDGAGAAILEPAEPGKGVKHISLHADGTGWDLIHMPAGGSRTPASHETVEQRQHYTQMRGREVYKFAVEKMQWLMGNCMESLGLTAEDIDLVVPHQVNMRIINSAAQRFGFPREKLFVNIEEYGNTSAASIPIALSEAMDEGKIQEGSTVMLVAFGAGLTWGGAILQF
jgi:3-oxoacyl-[acyl-carrier-protein] synthase III